MSISADPVEMTCLGIVVNARTGIARIVHILAKKTVPRVIKHSVMSAVSSLMTVTCVQIRTV